MIVASIGIQTDSVAGMWRTISLRACAPFLIGGVATMPVGICICCSPFARRPTSSPWDSGLALDGAYMLFRRPPSLDEEGRHPPSTSQSARSGGITGPLAALPGAFVAIWCGMRGWDKVVQRSVYQPFILIMQLLTLGALSLASGRSMLNADVIAYALPGIAGAYLGLHVFQKLSDGQFQRLVNLALIVSGIALVLK